MKLTDTEKEPFHGLRDVSDLRTQFQCEYRLRLKQATGNTSTPASVAGTRFHQLLASQTDIRKTENGKNRFVPLLIIIITLLVGTLWIIW
ncbi:MAG: hypothetical protein EAX87_03975 [Candidatus Thorarchaeota archaeon]|nr:hypothetical protein [Candidatus Thorarchaeota archaeon]